VEALEGRALPSVMQPLSLVSRPLDDPGAPLPGYTPAQIRHAYGIDKIDFGGLGTPAVADGSGETIAIVTAFSNPNLADDLAAFSTRFNLAAANLTVVAQDGSNRLPDADAAWAQETALDVEWAHAIAPGASLLVVEANTGNEADLYAAVAYAASQPNVHVVSMSFGGPEDASETNADQHFQTPANHDGVTFVAAAGDTGTVTYPAVSPYVVGVGGTTLALDASGNRVSETAWGNGGGGLSQFEPAPAFQQGFLPADAKNRGTPDVAYDASPDSGFAVYDSFGNPDQPWVSVGGTSAGAPQWAALIALADQGRRLSGKGSVDGATQTLPLLYGLKSGLYDVTKGGNGHYAAAAGYDLVTGLGTPDGAQVVVGLLGAPPVPDPPPSPPGGGGDGSPSSGGPLSGAPPLAIVPQAVTGVAGRPLDGVLAILTIPNISVSDLSVSIDWGDGTSAAGMVVSLGNGQYAIEGLLDYAQVGSDSITFTITDTTDPGHDSVTLHTVATVQPDSPAQGGASGGDAAAAPAVVSPLATPTPVVADPVPTVAVQAFVPAAKHRRHAPAHHAPAKRHAAARHAAAPPHQRPAHP
jgi:hypothetical protein